MFVRGDTVIGATYYGIYLSTDQGVSWTLRNNTGAPTKSFQSFAMIGRTVVTITSDGPYRSTDDGDTWEAMPPLSGGSILLPTLTSTADTLFLSLYNGYLFYSTDTASTWIPLNIPKSCRNVMKHDSLMTATDGSSNLYVSLDFGTTWTKRSTVSAVPSDFCTYWLNDTLFVGNASGVYRSVDHGFHWTACFEGLESPTVWSVYGDGPNLYAGTYANGTYRSTDYGAHWEAMSPSYRLDLGVPCILGVGDTVFAGTQGRGLAASSDRGNTWTLPTPGIASGGGVAVRALARSRGVIYASSSRSGDGIFISSDNGKSWVQNSSGLPANVSAADIAVQGDTVVIADYNGAFASLDKGVHWTAINKGIEYVHAKSVCFHNQDVWLAGDTTGVFYSSNFGQSWSAVHPDATNKHMCKVRRSANTVVAVTDAYYVRISPVESRLVKSDVFASPDKGRHWTRIGQGFSGLNLWAADVYNDKIYIGQQSRGLYTATLSDFDIKVDVPLTDESTSTANNFAFHNTIPTSLFTDESPQADVQLFDNLGHAKKCWSAQVLQSQSSLDITDLAPGCYCIKHGTRHAVVLVY